MNRFLAILCLLTFSANAATYYVRTDGNNANDGLTDSAAGAWRNINYAVHTDSATAAGDTVMVKAGLYNEFVTNRVSGSAGSFITITGERSGGGWSTIIDPSTSISNGWVDATAWMGAGVWAYTNTFITRELTITNYRVMGLHTLGDVASDIASMYESSGISNGVQLLALPSDTVVDLYSTYGTTPFWDALGALWAATNTVTYLRLRDGSSPEGLPVRAAPNREDAWDFDVRRPAIKIENSSYVIYSNLLVRNAFGGFHLGTSTHHVTLASNSIAGGHDKVFMYSASLGSGPYQNTVTGNTIKGDYYGTSDTGAWGTSASGKMRQNIYLVSKYLFSANASSFEYVLQLSYAGHSNVVSFNTISNGIGTGLSIAGHVTAPIHDTQVYGNTVEGFPSVGIHLSLAEVNTKIFSNYVADSESQFRLHRFNSADETNRLVYVYRNRSWLPDNQGQHFKLHEQNDGSEEQPTYWVFYNSMSGGMNGISAQTANTFSNVHWINNIISTADTFDDQATTSTNYFGSVDYNVFYPAPTRGTFFGTHNITNAALEWTNTEGMSFALAADSLAVDAAIDLSAEFTVQGDTFDALPQDGTAQAGSAWDIGTLEYSPPAAETRIVRATRIWIGGN